MRQVSGSLTNTGHDIRLRLDDSSTHHVNISGGPLSYHYRVAELVLHFGSTDNVGSEHTIDSLQFPAEVRCVTSNDRSLNIISANVKIKQFWEKTGSTLCFGIKQQNLVCL